MAKQIKCAFYARYSSDQQNAASIEDQYRMLQKRADTDGWKVVAKFDDRAISGTRDDRPGFMSMLAAAKEKKFEILLIESLSRLARDIIVQETAVRELDRAGVRMIGLDGTDTADEHNELMRLVHGGGNQQYLRKLAKETKRGQHGAFLKGFWVAGKPYGYSLDPIYDGTQRDKYGNRVQAGTRLKPDAKQAKIVVEIFKRFGDNQSERAIAEELNRRKVPSPGSSWDRKVRRSNGWMGSAIRAMLRSEIYGGKVIWNKSKWTKDKNRRVRKELPESEWLVRNEPDYCIVPDAVRTAVERRLKARVTAGRKRGADGKGRVQVHSGGKAKYVLSGLLKCDLCNAHLVLVSKTMYACSTRVNGGKTACSNDYYLNRDDLEQKLLTELKKQLLAPEMVAAMSKELTADYEKRLRTRATRIDELPKEVQALDVRIKRLKARLAKGDPDLTAGDLQAAISNAEQERLEHMHALQPSKGKTASAKVFAALPDAAARYEKKIVQGFKGNALQAAQAREILREIFGGEIRLAPTKKGLVARSALHKNVLIRAAEATRVSDGSGGTLQLSMRPQIIREQLV